MEAWRTTDTLRMLSGLNDFVDTSAIYALLDRDDQNHEVAGERWARLLESGEALFTTNYVVVEICALAH